MEQANLPTQQELSSLYGSWNPAGYMQGMQNQQLADQFRQQGLVSNDIANQTAAQTFNKNETMNPLLALHQQLTNTGQDLTNQKDQLGVDKTKALYDDNLAAERAKLKTMYSDEEMNQISNTLWKQHLANVKSGDPTKIAETGNLLDLFTGSAGKVADRVQNRNLNEFDQLMKDRMNERNNATQLQAAEIAANGRSNVANIKALSAKEAQGWKMNLNQRLAYLNAQDQNDPKVQDEIARVRNDLQQANAAYANALDLEKLNQGGLGRQGDRDSKPKLGTAENPIVLK